MKIDLFSFSVSSMTGNCILSEKKISSINVDEILFPFFLFNTIQLPLPGHFMLSAYEKQTAILIFVPTETKVLDICCQHMNSFYKSYQCISIRLM